VSWHCEIRKDREAIISPKVRPGRALWSVRAAHVRFGSGTDVAASLINVRFTPKSGHRNSVAQCLLCAKSGLMHRSKWHRFDQLIELQPSRLRQLDVRDNLLGNHGIKFLWADGHRFDTLRRKFGSHRGQCQRVLNLNVQLFDD